MLDATMEQRGRATKCRAEQGAMRTTEPASAAGDGAEQKSETASAAVQGTMQTMEPASAAV